MSPFLEMSVSWILHDVDYNRCKCINCSLEFVVQHEECRCCTEIDRCRERMAEVKKKKHYYLEIYLRITEISGNKHIEYFYEKENFMADSILKLR